MAIDFESSFFQRRRVLYSFLARKKSDLVTSTVCWRLVDEIGSIEVDLLDHSENLVLRLL